MSDKYLTVIRKWDFCGEDTGFDNDTSGEIRSIWMTVQDRCGQSNDLSPVWIFLLSVDER